MVILYSTGGQGVLAVVNKTCPQATPSDSVCLLPFSLPEGYKGKYGSYFPLHVLLVYSTLHCYTIVHILYTVVCK